MTHRLNSFALAALLLAALPAGAAEYEVRMLDLGSDGTMVFEPGYLRVSPGDTVTFVPADRGHSSRSVVIPEGAITWEGEPDDRISILFDTEGVYLYACFSHLPMAMVGVVQVGEPVNLGAVEAGMAELKEFFDVNAERAREYLERVQG